MGAVLCCAVLCCAVLCCAVLCCAVLCCAVLCMLKSTCVGGGKVKGMEGNCIKLLTLLAKLFECIVLTVDMMHLLYAKVNHMTGCLWCRAAALWS